MNKQQCRWWRYGILVMMMTVGIGLPVHAQTQPAKRDVDFERLLPWMDGSFSSEAQSKADTSFQHVVLHMKRIWYDRTDGAWFYVEQAMAAAQDRPYRQRVYNVRRVEQGMIESAVYTFKKPEDVIGAWKDTTLIDDKSPSELVKRRGCEVFLQADFASYIGRTMGMACASDLRGASYATSEVTISYDRIVSWDRGYNPANEQVWGSTAGPYIFLRTTPLPFGVAKE
ncbi:MAG: hypothetical protein FGM24_02950 [Candidatus Kapabacteria bacterium]|nr:hypothetical protein [Candidatus Kapabacteria bacterium]